ncbi:MAG: hypothetical protein ACLFOC_05400 [Campylobacterales bacterium]
MRYSFITPQEKKIFQDNTKVWMGLFALSIMMLLVFNLFLSYKQSDMELLKEENELIEKESVQKIASGRELLETLNKDKNFGEKVLTDNDVLKESLENLFELIPDQITVNETRMESDTLVIKGITPSKDVYEFLLAVPLKSIFSSSKATFYRLPNGWYNFISINKVDEEEVFFE